MYELKVLSEPDILPTSKVPEKVSLFYSSAKSRTNVLCDSFGRFHNYLRISLVEHCNLRCSYCMPEDGLDWTPSEQLLTDEEVIRLAQLFVGQGVTKIRLTGGEPLLRTGIEKIVNELSSLSGLDTLAMTTNALLLKRKLPALQTAGLSLVNISLDTLIPERFKQITRRNGLNLVLDAIDFALESGFSRLKVNCVVMRGVNEDEIVNFVELTRHRPIEVRFIEFMPFDGNRWDERQMVPYREMLHTLQSHYQIEALGSGLNETSKLYQVSGFLGRIGFITSMTDHFCEGCNRLRITADGNLKVCLFGRAEVNLRTAIRSGADDDDLLDLISIAIGGKHARHAGMHLIAASNNRPMITIGG